MKIFQHIALACFLTGQFTQGQITQLEQKETRTFMGTQNRGYGPYDAYKFSGFTNAITLIQGKKLDILDFYCKTGHTSYLYIDTKYESSSEVFRIFSTLLNNGSVTPSPSPVGRSIIGPATIYLILLPGQEEYGTQVGAGIEGNATFSTSTALWRYEIHNYNSDNEATSSPLVSSTSVVVPSNAIGDVDVLLEQSNDMITWTQCLPGTYNASTQKRFFRVRAVEK